MTTMAALGGNSIFSCLLYKYSHFGLKCLKPSLQLEATQIRSYAARKGTREKARAQKKKNKKVEEKKPAFIAHSLRAKERMKIPTSSNRLDDSWKSISTDNVWVAKYYKWRVYSFAEAVECHRETHHPTIYNMPDAMLNATIELDMTGEKKSRYLENLNRMAAIPHPFDQGSERSIIVFCKTPELQQLARDAGATLAGGSELIKDIQMGSLSVQDFQFVLAHPNILPDLALVRGLLKKKFPNPKSGSLGTNIEELVLKFLNGIQYTSTKDEHEEDYGLIETPIGNLDMDVIHLEANFAALLKDVNSVRPKREGPFITRVLLKSPPSIEKLKIALEPYMLDSQVSKKKMSAKEADYDDEEEDDDDEVEEKKSATASSQ